MGYFYLVHICAGCKATYRERERARERALPQGNYAVCEGNNNNSAKLKLSLLLLLTLQGFMERERERESKQGRRRDDRESGKLMKVLWFAAMKK